MFWNLARHSLGNLMREMVPRGYSSASAAFASESMLQAIRPPIFENVRHAVHFGSQPSIRLNIVILVGARTAPGVISGFAPTGSIGCPNVDRRARANARPRVLCV